MNQTKEVSLIFLLIDSSVESHWFSRFILPRIRLHQQLMNGRTSVGLHLEESIKAVNESDSIVQQQLVEDPFLRKILAKSCVSSISGSCCAIKQECFFELSSSHLLLLFIYATSRLQQKKCLIKLIPQKIK